MASHSPGTVRARSRTLPANLLWILWVGFFWIGTIGIGACILPRAAVAREGHDKPVTKVADQVAWKPTAIPDRILLSWTGDPAHTQAVTWRTDTSVTKGLARIAIAGHGPRFVEHAVEVVAETVPFESDLGMAHYHTVPVRASPA